MSNERVGSSGHFGGETYCGDSAAVTYDSFVKYDGYLLPFLLHPHRYIIFMHKN
jgi:hypothetical protein